jgi:hypothetical protein
VIPTLLLLGLVLGYWWKLVIPIGAVAWVAVLTLTGVGSGVDFAIGAALFAAANLAVGVLVFQAVRFVALARRRRGAH